VWVFINPHLCTDTLCSSVCQLRHHISPSHKAQRTALDRPQAKNLLQQWILAIAGRLAPDVLERLRRHRGIAYRVRYAGVAKEVLQPPRIHAPSANRTL
jgi:hypothetical protein